MRGDPFPPLPATGEEDADDPEGILPISESLRVRLLAWADQDFRYDGGDRDIDMSDFDEQDMLLRPRTTAGTRPGLLSEVLLHLRRKQGTAATIGGR